MSHKMKTLSQSEPVTCEKYLNRFIKQYDKASKKFGAPQEKLSTLPKQPPIGPFPRPKLRLNISQQNPGQKSTSLKTAIELQKEVGDNIRPVKLKTRQRSASSSASDKKEREPWGQLLINNKSRETISSFSNFDPLRTIHFLSKELYVRLQNVLPDDGDVQQMVSDIQHAIKRIPPEVATLIHIQSPFDLFAPIKTSSTSSPEVEDEEKTIYTERISTVNKQCQTPPTLYKEDTEKFQKIMEENAFRLEASCKQLEFVCNKLQNEKDMVEKELQEAKGNVEMLCKRVKDLELEVEQLTNLKIKQLEEDKRRLQKELDKALAENKNNPSAVYLKKVIEDLKQQKSNSDQACTKLEYDMALLKMEKEKFVTLLAVRDREIKDIQEEMSKIQSQVTKGFQKLNGEVLTKVSSVKHFSESCGLLDIKDNFLEIGDATISSIKTNESSEKDIVLFKETPCGDAVSPVSLEPEGHNFQKLIQKKASDVELNTEDADAVFQEFLKDLTPSCKSLLSQRKS